MNLKEQAASAALQYVKNGMVLGLGTGSTTRYFTEMVGKKVQDGSLQGIVAIPTSDDTARLAGGFGIQLSTVDDHDVLDLAVDGADEVDPHLNLIKGLGKALLREKIVEMHAKQFVVIVDESKMVERLGMKGPLPVEIVRFGAGAHVRWLNSLPGCSAELWVEDGKPAVTDNGNYLAKCTFEGGIQDVHILASELAQWPGIVEHGLFLDMAHTVIVATEAGPVVKSKK
ncbi:MAG: ribose 5-phosphate isomerase A [Candidatus Gracilibacteria bacterium]